MMKSPIYEQVLELSCELVNASGEEDTKRCWEIYQTLESTCNENKGSKSDHPLQWEALADFTTDDNVSISIYENALSVALKLNLNDYVASINFAMAERFLSLDKNEKSLMFAKTANEIAKKTRDLDLRISISEFLLNEHGST